MMQQQQQFETILHALDCHARTVPDSKAVTWVNGKGQETNKMTYQQLDDASNAVAAHLMKQGCRKGDRVMICYPFGLDFLAGLFGCMKIGAHGQSMYAPSCASKMEKKRFQHAKFVLSTNDLASTLKDATKRGGPKWIGTDTLPAPSPAMLQKIRGKVAMASRSDIALVQCQAGTTKGVTFTHDDLLCRKTRRMTPWVGSCADKPVIGLWLPQFHAKGLVAAFMGALYSGMHMILASPLEYMSKPQLLNDMVEQYSVDMTCGPNCNMATYIRGLCPDNNNKKDTKKQAPVKKQPTVAAPVQKPVAPVRAVVLKPEHDTDITETTVDVSTLSVDSWI